MMRVIGVFGGIASGKSFVTRELARLGASVLDADQIGHEVLCQPQVEAAARVRWGNAIFDDQGRIDRRRLARIVFAPPPEGPVERTYLERLTHPEIALAMEQALGRLACEGVRVAVLDAPLLFEAGWDRFCNGFLLVDAPQEQRLARAKSRGWSEEEFAARQRAQAPLDSKRNRAEVVIDNSGSPEQTRNEVELFWRSIVGR